MRNEKGALHLEVLSAMPGRIRFQLEKPIKSDVPFLGIKGVTRCRYNPRIGTLLCEYDQLTATEEQLLVKIGAVYAGLVGTALLHIKHSEEEGFSMAPSGYLALCCIALDGTCPAHFHAHRADDIFTALRIAKEFSIKPVILHGTEAHLVADILAEEHVPICSGPFLTDRSKPELHNLTEQAPALLTQAGIETAITTDHPETTLKHYMQCIVAAVQAGMEPMDALRAVTIVPARIAGLDDRIGSLRVGKDADLLVTDGDPLDYRTKVTAVYIDGKQVK